MLQELKNIAPEMLQIMIKFAPETLQIHYLPWHSQHIQGK